jgi:uncharacterized protein YdeI (BOF family)
MESNFAKQRIIEDIEPNDLKIQVTGYVKKKVNDNQFILDDKSGQLKVLAKDVNFIPEVDDLVTIFGELEIQTSGEKILNAYIIQDMNKLNFDYYLKIYKLQQEIE